MDHDLTWNGSLTSAERFGAGRFSLAKDGCLSAWPEGFFGQIEADLGRLAFTNHLDV